MTLNIEFEGISLIESIIVYTNLLITIPIYIVSFIYVNRRYIILMNISSRIIALISRNFTS